ncbi:MAG TPA: hybrid sensor histidine kinase/response regulator [Longimicrobiales bacterium]|nr:hybrid sensor histidine kinase/response regulator [Longimicrobiales bacterium]
MSTERTQREILVVEGSPAQARALGAALEDAGYAARIAGSGEAALEELRRRPADLVLTDALMPGLSGYDLCRLVGQEPALRDIPVVLLTSLSDPLDVVRGLECGAHNYIATPVEPERLLARVASIFEEQAARRTAPPDAGVPITFRGRHFTIRAEREQILDLLVSSFEELARASEALRASEAQRALQLEREREARAEAEATTRRVRLLQAVTEAALHRTELDAFLGEVLRAVTQALGADAALVLLCAAEGRDLEVRAAHGVGPELSAGTRVEAGRGIAGRILERRQGMLVPDLTRSPELGAARLRRVLRSAVGAPMLVDGEPVGVLLMGSRTLREFDEADLRMLGLVADRVAVAVDRARLREGERAARLEAEAANRAKSDFLAAMSHDLRTPLTAISGYADLLLIGARGPLSETQLEFVRRIQRSQRHLLSLVNDLLSFSRAEAGQVPLTLVELPVRDITGGLGELIEPQLAERGLRFEYRPCPGGVSVRADIEKAQQVLLNLLSNAVKFTEPGGAITLRCEARGEATVAIHVDDTGPGIPAERLESIFDPFVQVSSEEPAARHGVGLGLAISRNLAHAMDGDLTAASALGAGSTFTLTLPRAPGS